MQQPEHRATDVEISAELPARFANFMEHSAPSEKQVLLLIFRERAERRNYDGADTVSRRRAQILAWGYWQRAERSFSDEWKDRHLLPLWPWK